MPVTKVDVEMNPAFWDSIGFDPGVESVLDAIADTAVTIAKANAPYDSGDYQRSIHKETSHTGRRVLKRVVADDWKTHFIEARTGNLRKAAAQARRT